MKEDFVGCFISFSYAQSLYEPKLKRYLETCSE